MATGREKLKENLEQRSGALKLLVEAEWDRFVGVKATTESESVPALPLAVSAKEDLILTLSTPCATAVFEEMKHSGGPLEATSDYGVKEIRETLKRACPLSNRAYQYTTDAATPFRGFE